MVYVPVPANSSAFSNSPAGKHIRVVHLLGFYKHSSRSSTGSDQPPCHTDDHSAFPGVLGMVMSVFTLPVSNPFQHKTVLTTNNVQPRHVDESTAW